MKDLTAAAILADIRRTLAEETLARLNELLANQALEQPEPGLADRTTRGSGGKHGVVSEIVRRYHEAKRLAKSAGHWMEKQWHERDAKTLHAILEYSERLPADPEPDRDAVAAGLLEMLEEAKTYCDELGEDALNYHYWRSKVTHFQQLLDWVRQLPHERSAAETSLAIMGEIHRLCNLPGGLRGTPEDSLLSLREWIREYQPPADPEPGLADLTNEIIDEGNRRMEILLNRWSTAAACTIEAGKVAAKLSTLQRFVEWIESMQREKQ